MTTVGYGDIVPVTNLGKIVGSITCVCAILDVAFTLPIFVFEFVYNYNLNQKSFKIDPTAMIEADDEDTRRENIDNFRKVMMQQLIKSKQSFSMDSKGGADDGDDASQQWNQTKHKASVINKKRSGESEIKGWCNIGE